MSTNIKPDFSKSSDGLLPAIIVDATTSKVLMLGYMNREAFDKTEKEKRVTFFSRSKNRLWTKGEESGNFLDVKSVAIDCDNDTFLVKVVPHGPVCHTGTDTCWGETNPSTSPGQVAGNFLKHLEEVIQSRKNADPSSSYTASLFAKGINKIAQKVGEEATEIVIEAKDNNDELFLGEAADLLFHYLILLAAKNKNLGDVIEVLERRHKV
ncbi:MAG TPA: bifunctional phosphoribosyl-AMP cyclohydrolase/phosphoribosyl-ATP diphosphatase HisIE [Bacteroidia bacterium]|jgi:phosphoribosyl-ATP pyrophosphohydrolase/phosphoribosyl-AMP cyclohydrolase|nr:bifunctional phosphoribosyl-AMP cyclohydrolase/phosphoribosyl-ATP diphosphatase HisIE [Bacteroidia bacterium]